MERDLLEDDTRLEVDVAIIGEYSRSLAVYLDTCGQALCSWSAKRYTEHSFEKWESTRSNIVNMPVALYCTCWAEVHVVHANG